MRNSFIVYNKQQSGFTLLEVIVAMAIVGLVLGTLFSLLAGSKRLAFKASHEVEQTIFLRAALNAAQVLDKPKYPALPEESAKTITLRADKVLEPSKKQTQKINLGLEAYTLVDKEKGTELSSIRWKVLDSAQ